MHFESRFSNLEMTNTRRVEHRPTDRRTYLIFKVKQGEQHKRKI